jgi:hypothetical protein
MDHSSPEIVEEDQLDSDDEAHSGLEDIPLNTRFKRLSQGPRAGVEGQNLVPGGPVVTGDVSETSNLKNNVQEYFVQWKSCSHAHNKWIPEKELEKLAPKELARFKKMLAQGQVLVVWFILSWNYITLEASGRSGFFSQLPACSSRCRV